MSNGRKSDSPIDAILSLGQLVLIVIGLVGISMQVFGDQGLLSRLLRKLMAIESAMALAAIPILFVIFMVLKNWFVTTKGDEATSSYGNLLMYVMMGIGAFFIYRYLSTGSLVI